MNIHYIFNKNTIRIYLILLWAFTFGLLIFGGYSDIKSFWWPYLGITIALVSLIVFPYLRNIGFVQRFMPLILPISLMVGIIGNIYFSKEFIDRSLLYNQNKGDRLTYWFDRYAVKMNNASFYLKMREIMAGNAIVSIREEPLRKYDALTVSHLKDFAIKDYVPKDIGPVAFRRLRDNNSLRMKTIVMLNVQKENRIRKVEPIPFLFFLRQDKKNDTYYLHSIKLNNPLIDNQTLKGYIAIPEKIHTTILSSKR